VGRGGWFVVCGVTPSSSLLAMRHSPTTRCLSSLMSHSAAIRSQRAWTSKPDLVLPRKTRSTKDLTCGPTGEAGLSFHEPSE